MDDRLKEPPGGGGGGGRLCIGSGGTAPGIGGGGRLFLFPLNAGDDRGTSSAMKELRFVLDGEGSPGDANGTGGGARLVGGNSVLGVSIDTTGFSDNSSSDSDPILGDLIAAGGGGGGGRAIILVSHMNYFLDDCSQTYIRQEQGVVQAVPQQEGMKLD